MQTTVGYAEYLNSPEWGAKRNEKLAEVGHRCQGCAETERLEVHHLTYERLGHERTEDLMVLCHLCHSLEHGHVPNHVGEVAGPSRQELTRRVREREEIEDHQLLTRECSSLIVQMAALRQRFLDDKQIANTLKRSIRNIEAIQRLKPFS